MTIAFKSLKVKDETYEMLVRARDKMSEKAPEKKISFDEVIMSLSENEVPNGNKKKTKKSLPEIDQGPIWGFGSEDGIL